MLSSSCADTIEWIDQDFVLSHLFLKLSLSYIYIYTVEAHFNAEERCIVSRAYMRSSDDERCAVTLVRRCSNGSVMESDSAKLSCIYRGIPVYIDIYIAMYVRG